MIKIIPDHEQIEKHNKRMQEDKQYAEIVGRLQFKVGTILKLKIEVTNELLSESIMSLLYDKIDGSEFLGFKVTAVDFKPTADKDNFREFLKKTLYDLDN